ncbi:MAG: phage portal protein [Phycisphaerales bacterium]|nr:phage portal protein [Planctomycetota bacterium]MCH8509683.1 phage portal protein [Phycisphaerales bacterium]
MPGQPERKSADADALWGALSLAIGEHRRRELPRQEKLWAYYRNPLGLVGASGTDASTSGGWYRQAQEAGLPRRIRGRAGGVTLPGAEPGRREVVIENDIAWRVQTMVDFMFGRPVRFESLASDAGTRARAERLIESVWERSGGIAMMQDAALLGHIFGHVDLLLRVDASRLGGSLEDAVGAFTIEPVDPRRGVPLVSPEDYRELDAYAVHACRPVRSRPRGPVGRALDAMGRDGEAERKPEHEAITEVFAPGVRRVYRDGERVSSERSGLLADTVPVIHIQNVSQPFVYGGVGEVEPLVALQDELNTRLSDRAYRVTLQSFRMYLAKGIESFDGASIGPGTVWSTNNPDASIQAFGGDLYNPGEESHIQEIREALDKISGVPPLAGGVVRAKLGNLSSANALRVTLMGLIAKTQRKRISYGRGMERVGSLILRALHESGTLRIGAGERSLRTVWPGFVFEDERDRLAAARQKQELGVDGAHVLADLGEDRRDPGVV